MSDNDRTRRRIVALAIVWTLFIVFACLLPADRLHRAEPNGSWFEFPNRDKVIHAALFVGFGGFWTWGLTRRRLPAIAVGGLLLALATEWAQGLPAIGRTTDLADGLADLVGLVFGIALVRFRRDSVSS